jgi:hypothetical protein
MPVLINLIVNYFQTIEQIKSKNKENNQRFRTSIVPLVIVNNLMTQLSDDSSIVNKNDEIASLASPIDKMSISSMFSLVTNLNHFKNRTLSKRMRRIIKNSDLYKKKMDEFEGKAIQLEPNIENRIILIKNKEVKFIFIKQNYLNK